MTVDIVRARFDDVLRVAETMRAADRREVFATRWDEDAVRLAAEAVNYSSFAWVARYRGEPAAAFGAFEESPHVFNVWMFATDRWRKVASTVTRHIEAVAIPALLAAGANRAHCKSIDGYATAHAWLRRLGAARESVQPGIGKNGEAFHVFAWYRNEFPNGD
jgi:hypothetical protein